MRGSRAVPAAVPLGPVDVFHVRTHQEMRAEGLAGNGCALAIEVAGRIDLPRLSRRLDRAVATNAGGTLLAVLTVLIGPWLLVSGVCGRWYWQPPNEWFAVGVCFVVVSVTVLDWAIRCLLALWS